MTETTADNRPTSPAAARSDGEHVATEQMAEPQSIDPGIDPLDVIAAELDGLEDLDPADAVPVLADITAELNRELDEDTDRS